MRINSIQYSHIRGTYTPQDEGREYVAKVPTGNNLPRTCPDELSMSVGVLFLCKLRFAHIKALSVHFFTAISSSCVFVGLHFDRTHNGYVLRGFCEAVCHYSVACCCRSTFVVCQQQIPFGDCLLGIFAHKKEAIGTPHTEVGPEWDTLRVKEAIEAKIGRRWRTNIVLDKAKTYSSLRRTTESGRIAECLVTDLPPTIHSLPPPVCRSQRKVIVLSVEYPCYNSLICCKHLD